MSGHPILPSEPITLPLLPLRDVVVFPHMVIPLFVGRPKSTKALDAAMEADGRIMLVGQKAAGTNEPRAEDMFEIGCVSSILEMLKLPDGTLKVLVEGIQRASVRRISVDGAHFVAESVPVAPATGTSAEVDALRSALMQQVGTYVELNQNISPERLTSIAAIDDLGDLTDTIAARLPLKDDVRRAVLELFDVPARAQKMLDWLEEENAKLLLVDREQAKASA